MPAAKMVQETDSYEAEIDEERGDRLGSLRQTSFRRQPQSNRSSAGPVDLDDIFTELKMGTVNEEEDEEDASLFSDDSDDGLALNLESEESLENNRRVFVNPNKRLLDNDASLIPGSPFSKPANRRSNRPEEPLQLAKYASTLAFTITAAIVGGLLFNAIWSYSSIARILVEVLLALMAFLGLFWNTYFTIGSIFKMFIPNKAFTTNTKYCSIIPELKLDGAEWCVTLFLCCLTLRQF